VTAEAFVAALSANKTQGDPSIALHPRGPSGCESFLAAEVERSLVRAAFDLDALRSAALRPFRLWPTGRHEVHVDPSAPRSAETEVSSTCAGVK
jgi:hypothetical protein